MKDRLVPDESTIYGWIEEIFAQGVRRPGYPADRWAENHYAEQFRSYGLDNVRLEPVILPSWEPQQHSLRVRAGGRELTVPCFALPHTAPTDGLEAELRQWRGDAAAAVKGHAALVEVKLMRSPANFVAPLFARRGVHDDDATWRCYDPGGTLAGAMQVLPFGHQFQAVMEPAIAAGAAAFVGVLTDYPGNSHQYYVPYDAVARPIPGVWVSGHDGARLRQLCESGAVHVTVVSRNVSTSITTYNIVGELPGRDDATVIIGSHHDGPWSSAVEDGSGIALVLAQAAYWSQIPRAERPHRLVFLLNAGHMAGGAGVRSFIERHRDALDHVVLEVHLEHTANEYVERNGELVCTGHPEPRWWFTTRLGPLESAVRAAVEAEQLDRSLILPPDIFGPHPTTDGGPFHLAGVPLVNFLTAPFYLFDEMDTLDKIHRPSLVPVTRAAIRIVEATQGISPAAMRAARSSSHQDANA